MNDIYIAVWKIWFYFKPSFLQSWCQEINTKLSYVMTTKMINALDRKVIWQNLPFPGIFCFHLFFALSLIIFCASIELDPFWKWVYCWRFNIKTCCNIVCRHGSRDTWAVVSEEIDWNDMHILKHQIEHLKSSLIN